MRPGSKDLKGFPEPASDDQELKSLVGSISSDCCPCLLSRNWPTPQDRNSGWSITFICPQAREVRCAAFATTAALVVATQGADKLQFYKKPFELAGGLCKGAAMPALLQQHIPGNACTLL